MLEGFVGLHPPRGRPSGEAPRATCEIQGYVYDAKVRCARLARTIWEDRALEARLEMEAADLKRRFNRDFWIEEGKFFALALDGDKKPVDSLTSNIGHLLWSGIVEEDKIEACVRHLLGERLFSGWGVRTMAEGDAGYNPIGTTSGPFGRTTIPSLPGACAGAGIARKRRNWRWRCLRRPPPSEDGFRRPLPDILVP
jgi:hypothetical protein